MSEAWAYSGYLSYRTMPLTSLCFLSARSSIYETIQRQSPGCVSGP
jgi:hypothetical protein